MASIKPVEPTIANVHLFTIAFPGRGFYDLDATGGRSGSQWVPIFR
jgi:hypothetical protein